MVLLLVPLLLLLMLVLLLLLLLILMDGRFFPFKFNRQIYSGNRIIASKAGWICSQTASVGISKKEEIKEKRKCLTAVLRSYLRSYFSV